MPTTFERSFDSLHKRLTTARCQIRRDSDVVEKAIASGVTYSRDRTDEGLDHAASCSVRFKKRDAPPYWADKKESQGKRREARFFDGEEWGEWSLFRIEDISSLGPIIVYTLNTEWATT
jgi:hypothetical protein